MDLHKSKIHIAAASRTHAPKAARQALTELLIPGSIDSDDLLKGGKAKNEKELVSSINLFDSMEIYPGSKITHFQALHKKTGIPYEEMVSPFLTLPSFHFRPSPLPTFLYHPLAPVGHSLLTHSISKRCSLTTSLEIEK